ncbi:MAG: 2Fe-2S iron-sulfur cluster binding domain-containing protein [Bacteroidetes bacterium]|nr:2Fe-2S iron-sulfur cluster binding domain-containing protein [Bacteroidota bacterium]
MARFHKLKIKDIKRETNKAVSLAFDIPPLQQAEYQFKQGQYLTLKLNLNGEELRRSYSICTSPFTDKDLRVAVKEVEGGAASTYINRNLKVGDEIEVMTPMGNFYTTLSGANKKNYVLFAGGSGITPMMSIVKSILHIEKQSSVTLIYANKDIENTIFKTELDAIAQQSAAFKLIYVFENASQAPNDLQTGIITQEKCSKLVQQFNLKDASDFFICGPGPLMDNVKNALQAANIANDKIKIEYFSAVVDAVNKAIAGNDAKDVTADVTVVQYGIETNFKLNTSGISVLDASIEAGIDAPFSCKGGVCCTCRAKVIEGSVKMNVNFALTDDEVKNGYILTCQSHPTSQKLVIDFDAI